jgi:hypothetical protein
MGWRKWPLVTPGYWVMAEISLPKSYEHILTLWSDFLTSLRTKISVLCSVTPCRLLDTSVPEELRASNFTVSYKISPLTTLFLPNRIPPKSFLSSYRAWTILNMDGVASQKTENQMLIIKEIIASSPSSPPISKNIRSLSFLFSLAQEPLVALRLLTVEALRPQSDTSHSGGLLWTSDRPDAQISTWQLTTLKANRQQPWRRTVFEPAVPASDRPQSHAVVKQQRYLFLTAVWC